MFACFITRESYMIRVYGPGRAVSISAYTYVTGPCLRALTFSLSTGATS